MEEVEVIEIERKINYIFKNKNLIVESFKHRSIDKSNNNTKYELLGDRIINLYVTTYIFDKCNNTDLLHTNLNNIITNKCLSKVYNCELKKYIKCTDTVKNNFKDDCKIESNIFEVLIGAIYLDNNKDYKFISNYLYEKTKMNMIIDNNFKNIIKKDFKTRLQEYTSKNNMGYPKYETKQLNKDESMSICIINNREYKKGNGRNKKEAEQYAAKLTWLDLGLDP